MDNSLTNARVTAHLVSKQTTSREHTTSTSTHSEVIAGTMATNTMAVTGRLTTETIEIETTSAFVLDTNDSHRAGNRITICFSGTVTGDLSTGSVEMGSIPASLAPTVAHAIPVCLPSVSTITVIELTTDGILRTCPPGIPIVTDGSFPVSGCFTYLL